MKIRITESQLKELKSRLNEEQSQKFKFIKKVPLRFYSSKSDKIKFNGADAYVDGVLDYMLKYDIKINFTDNGGVSGVDFVNLDGDNYVETTFTHGEQKGTDEELKTKIALNFQDFNVDVDSGNNVANIESIDVYLMNGSKPMKEEDGTFRDLFIVDEIRVQVNYF